MTLPTSLIPELSPRVPSRRNRRSTESKPGDEACGEAIKETILSAVEKEEPSVGEGREEKEERGADDGENEGEEEPSTDDDVVVYQEWTTQMSLRELRDACTARKLSTSGKKTDLARRLNE